MNKRRITSILFATMLVLFMSASITLAQDTRPEGWDEYSHGNETAPDYEVVFPQDAVNTITITFSPETWQAMQDDMTSLFGEFGSRRRGGSDSGNFAGEVRPQGDMLGPMPEGFNPENLPEGVELPEGFDPENLPEGFQPPQGNVIVGGGVPGAGAIDFAEEDPIWVAADISFNGQTWTNVGFRYKGNSTLMGAWGSGSLKLGFKFNFDRYEDD